MLTYHNYLQQVIIYVSWLFFLGITIFYFNPVLLFTAIVFHGVFVSAFYHRYLTHNSWLCPRWLQYILTFLSAGFAILPVLHWVAIHRKHHRYSDTINDPHGPTKTLLQNINFGLVNVELKYAGKLLKDNLYILQSKYYFHIVFLFFLAWSFIFSYQSYFYITGFVFFSNTMVALLGHLTNWTWCSIIFNGEMYHNEHHNNPNNSKFGLLDLPYCMLIKWFPILK